MAGDRITRIVLRGDVSGLQASFKSAAGLTRNLAADLTSAEKEAIRFRQGLATVGPAATRMGLVAAGGVALVTKAAMDWESAWAGVTKTVEGTPAQLSAIEQGIRNMTGVLPSSHQELAAIAEAAGQLGVQTDSILAFTRVAADLGETTNLSAESAATGLAQFMNVMQTAPQDVDRLGSTLVELGNNGASTESQILDMAQGIAGAGSVIGASEADILALSNALASVGIEAEAGGSSISRILIDMSSAVQTNSADLETWATVAGMSADEFAEAFQDRPVEAFNAFTQGLGRLNEEGGNVFAVLESLGQTDVRVSRALLGMAKSGDLLTDSLAQGSSEWERNTALTEEAEKRYDTTAAKAAMAWNDIKDSAIDAGQAMLPVVAGIAESVGLVTGAFGALPGPVKSSVGVLGAFSAAGLLAVGGVAKLVTSVASAREALDSLSVTMPKTAGALGRIAKGAAIAGASLAGLRIIGELVDTDDVASVSAYADAILNLSDGAGTLNSVLTNSQGIGSQIAGLSDLASAIKEADPGALNEKFGQAFGIIGANPYKDAMEDVAAYDDALTSLVQQGALEEAARGAEFFAEAAAESGRNADDVARLLPDYNNALLDAENSQRIAGDSAQQLGSDLSSLSPEAQAAQEELEALKNATRDSALAFDAFSENLNPDEMGFNDWIQSLEDMANAQADWADNLIVATARGVDEGVIQKFQEMGPEGARRLAELADATDSEIARVNEAFRSTQSEANNLAESLNGVPKEVITQVSAMGADSSAEDVAQLLVQYDLTPDQVQTILEALDFSSSEIRAVQALLRRYDGSTAIAALYADGSQARAEVWATQQVIDSLTGKTVGIRVAGPGGGGMSTAQADGSVLDFYADGGMRENHVAQIAPAGAWRVWAEPETGGEAYIPLAESKRKRSLEIWAETGRRLNAYAEGAVIGGTTSTSTQYARLVDSRVRPDRDGFMRLIDDRVEIGLASHENYRAGQSRAGRR